VIGFDPGVKALATLSDGTVISNPKPLKRRLKQLKRLHRAVSRKHKGSTNRKKAARKLATQYRIVAQQRANTLQRVTKRLVKTKSVIVIEDLYVAGLLGHAQAPASGTSHRRCGLCRVSPPPDLQSGVVRRPGRGRRGSWW
jgi:putative transposase